MTRKWPLLLLAATLAPTPTACDRMGGSSGGLTVHDQTAIEQTGRMLRVYQKGLKPPSRGAVDLPVYQAAPVPPPRGTRDIMPMAKGFPLAVKAIRGGDVLIYWKTDLSDDADAASTVLAFAKDVPEKGGQVLMRDGSIRTMTARQFQEARKPEGAKTDDPMPVPAPRT